MCFFICGWNGDQRNSIKDGLIVTVSSGDELRERALLTSSGAHRRPRTSFLVPIYKKVSRRQCPLINCTWERQWPRVLERVSSHPSEASCLSDFSGRTALHLASFNHGCPNFVADALIRANPHALVKQDSYGQTPLHYACQFRAGTNDLVLLYCEKLEEHASNGMDVLNTCPPLTASPLYLACKRNGPIRIIEALVSTRRSIGVCWIAPVTGAEPFWKQQDNTELLHDDQDGTTTTPLSVLVDSCKISIASAEIDPELRHEMRNAALRMLSRNGEEVETLESDRQGDSNDGTTSLWLKILVLLRQEFLEYASDNDGASLLHLVASLKVPLPILTELCSVVFEEELSQRDSRGYLPLHYAIINPKSLFYILLRKRPSTATFCFPDGQSPMAVAVKRRNVDFSLLEDLAMADPDGLTRRDLESSLLPFQLAASLDSDEDTIYGLLRLRPDLLST